jgi:hypothetical protein
VEKNDLKTANRPEFQKGPESWGRNNPKAKKGRISGSFWCVNQVIGKEKHAHYFVFIVTCLGAVPH